MTGMFSTFFIFPTCLHVQILQDLVTFVHSQAVMLKEQSTTIEKQSETIGVLSASVRRLEEDNLVRFHQCSFQVFIQILQKTVSVRAGLL